MTAHLPLDTTPLVPSQGDRPLGRPTHPISTTGASIIALHVHEDGCGCPTCIAQRMEQLALDRLGAFLADEVPSLDRILRLLGLRGARADLTALETLHVEPGGEAEALVDAARLLTRISRISRRSLSGPRPRAAR